jgi:hypothetical protein
MVVCLYIMLRINVMIPWCYTPLLSLPKTLPEKNITLNSKMHSFILRFSLKFTVIKLLGNTTQMKPSVNRD